MHIPRHPCTLRTYLTTNTSFFLPKYAYFTASVHTSDIFDYIHIIFTAEVCIFHGIHAHFGLINYQCKINLKP